MSRVMVRWEWCIIMVLFFCLILTRHRFEKCQGSHLWHWLEDVFMCSPGLHSVVIDNKYITDNIKEVNTLRLEKWLALSRQFQKCFDEQNYCRLFDISLKFVPRSPINHLRKQRSWGQQGPTWVLLAPDGPHVGPINLATREYVITDVGVAWCCIGYGFIGTNNGLVNWRIYAKAIEQGSYRTNDETFCYRNFWRCCNREFDKISLRPMYPHEKCRWI